MGCDIHSFAEKKINGKWVAITTPTFDNKTTIEPFKLRSYGIFGFLADVRNYSVIPPICELKGLPQDSEWLNGPGRYSDEETRRQELLADQYYSYGHLYLSDLLNFNYDSTFEDRRHMVRTGENSWDCGATAESGSGIMTTYRDFLGQFFFSELEVLKSLGDPDDVRIVFWFDS